VVEHVAERHCGAHVRECELVALIKLDQRIALTVVQDEARPWQLQLPRMRRLGHATQPVYMRIRRKRVLWRDTRPAFILERQQRRLLVGDGALERNRKLGPSAEQLGMQAFEEAQAPMACGARALAHDVDASAVAAAYAARACMERAI
jgi:hypothetical protein